MTDDELYDLAFRGIHDVAEKLRADGREAAEVWAVIFAATQDLQAADFGIGSDEHRGTLVMQRDRLLEDVVELL